MDTFSSAADLITKSAPDLPVLCLRPHAATRAARWFCDYFPGKVLYAVKANDTDYILRALLAANIRDFDVAAQPELESVSALDGATAHLMHPIKSRALIRSAYHDHGVRSFAVDCEQELDKILAETSNATDLTLMVRIACPNAYSEIPLEGKFGVSLAEAGALLARARRVAQRLGLTFHVGSQAMSPAGFGEALRATARYIGASGVPIDVVDVGGGFPSLYPGLEPPPLIDFVTEISNAFDRLWVGETCELWTEPGRALVAEAESVIVRVEARKGSTLYVNDGAFGTLFDAAHAKFVFPTRGLRPGVGEMSTASMGAFSLYGPTCDSFDYLPGPFCLPAGIDEGDFIEIGNIGAYGRVMSTRFNGFGHYAQAILTDEPMLSMYGAAPIAAIAAVGAGH